MENDNTFGGNVSYEVVCVNAATIDANYRRELASRKAFGQPGLDIESFIVVKHQLWLCSIPFLNNNKLYRASQVSIVSCFSKLLSQASKSVLQILQ